MSDTTTVVSEGERVVIGIELPKNKPQSPTRKVSFEPAAGQQYPPAGWIYADQLGSIAIGDLVSYRIEKNAEGFNKLTHIAPVSLDDGERDQTPASAAAQDSGRDDAQAGDLNPPGQPESPAERAIPNTDLARFEGWAFVANVGMVELAFQELTDALESGALDEIRPDLLHEIARLLLVSADYVQRGLVGRTDRSAQSHVRARGAVRTALIKYPVASGLGDLDAWTSDVTKTAKRFLLVAASL